MEPHIIHRALMSGEFMEQLPTTRFPNSDAPIPTPCRNLLPIRTPTRLQQILLHPRRRAIVRPHMSVRGRERSYIPRADCGVMCVGKDVLRVGGYLE